MSTTDLTPVPTSYADSVFPEDWEWRIDYVAAQRERRCYLDVDDFDDVEGSWAA
jgi:hypothetical protein